MLIKPLTDNIAINRLSDMCQIAKVCLGTVLDMLPKHPVMECLRKLRLFGGQKGIGQHELCCSVAVPTESSEHVSPMFELTLNCNNSTKHCRSLLCLSVHCIAL